MIRGSYQLRRGASITAAVYFPSPIDVQLPITFLVDTGAERSILAVSELEKLDLAIRSRIPLRPVATTLRGIGGIVDAMETDAGLIFRHESSEISLIALELVVLSDTPDEPLPSILGRDVLFNGPILFEPHDGEVHFDLPIGLLR